MTELVVISGKGGTGKTSLAASFAVLAGDAVVADCDVDAADLPLVLAPQVRRREEFRSGHTARIRESDCIRCGVCLDLCRFDAIARLDAGTQISCHGCDICERSCSVRNEYILAEMCQISGGGAASIFAVDPLHCEGCGVCVRHCPAGAIEFVERRCGQWFISETRCGPLIHAQLGAAAESSGKLVSLVRAQAREAARRTGRDLIIIDGAPGIGCPVIASLAGATAALIVTEPTVAGRHDLERVAALARHFGVPTRICVNKWDLNPEIAQAIEAIAREAGLPDVGRVRYDRAVTAAQVAGTTVVEFAANGAAADVRAVWRRMRDDMIELAAQQNPTRRFIT